MKILDELNVAQRQAVEAGDGPVVIVAGPGTGKTKTLTARIAYLLHERAIPPQEILALTFTNKAARELHHRLIRVRPLQREKYGVVGPTIATFHALAHKVLDPAQRGTLVSPAERDEILRRIKKQLAAKDSARDIGLYISKAKNELQPPSDPMMGQLLAAYNAELAAVSRYDFDDLLLRLHEVLREGKVHTAYQYILVDEFQDTNVLQYELLKQLNQSDNLFVIGDPLQSIYGFRGASAAIFDQFKQDWPAHRAITLDTNYRSTPQVVRASCAIFSDAPRLRAYRDQPGKVCVLEVLNEYSEADWIVNEIERQVGGSTMLRSQQYHTDDQQCTFKDFAVLYRTHAVARTVQRRLEASGMPYQVAGEGSPYEQPYIQAITGALGYLAGTESPPTISGYKPSQIEALLEPLKAHTDTLTMLVTRIIELLNLQSERHATALRQFINSLVPFDIQPLTAYLQHLRHIADQEYYDPMADAVTFLTIHAAKGLEFSKVFLIAAEDGTLPYARPGRPPANLDEERRLFYVAATRARDELYMLHARSRSGEQRRLSDFVAALPAADVERIVDPALVAQQRNITRRQQKRAQGSLF